MKDANRKAMMAKKKPIKLGFFHLGNGITVGDENHEEHGDFKTLAHISADGKDITYNSHSLPLKIRNKIKQRAEKLQGI